MVRTAIENRVDIIFFRRRSPLDMPRHLLELCEQKKEEFKTKLVPIVSSGALPALLPKMAVALLLSYGLTPFVVEGPKAGGGHLGFKTRGNPGSRPLS